MKTNARKQGTGLRLERVDQVDIVEKRTGEKADFTGRRVLAWRTTSSIWR